MAQVSNVQEALRYTYGVSKVLYLFNEEAVTWRLLGGTKKPMGGRGQFLMPLWVQNPGAFTGIGEGGALPSALQPDTAEASFGLQEYVATYDVTWKLIQDARSDKFAFARAIQMLDEGLKRRIFRNLNSDLLGTGRGELAILPAADNSSPITVNALPRVEKGMVIDIMAISDDDTKRLAADIVTGVDPIARTVSTTNNPAGTAAGDYFVIRDTTDVTSLGAGNARHSNGLLGVVDSSNPAAIVGNYGNIDRSTAGNEFWQSVELGNGGTLRPLTEDLGLQALDGAREKGGAEIDAWLWNPAISRRYHEILRSDTIVTLSSPSEIGGGVGRKRVKRGETGNSPYEFSGVPVHEDPFFFANTIVGLDMSHFYLGVGENEVPRPISEIFDTQPFFRQTANATFEVVWYYQMELLSDNPAAGVKIADVAES